MRLPNATLALAMGCSLLFAFSASAADYEIRMLNKGANGAMVFEPSFLKVAPGDTVTFVPTDKTHNTESIKDMLPEGAEPWKGKVNEEVKITLSTEGIYGVKCTPHYAMGMVAVIQVGDNPPNLAAAKAVKHPAIAQKRIVAAFEQNLAAKAE